MKFQKSFGQISMFVILGIFIFGSIFQGAGRNDVKVASVGSKKITVSDVFKYYGLVHLPQGYDRKDDNVQQYLFYSALEIAVRRTLFTLEAKRLGLFVSDDKVIEFILNDKAFMQNDAFSREIFLNYLAQRNMTEHEYKLIVKEDLLHTQLYYLFSCALIVPDDVVKSVADSYKQVRNGAYFVVDRSKIKIPSLSVQELQKFYKENIEKFTNKAFKEYIVVIVPKRNGVEISDIESKVSSGSEKNLLTKYGGYVTSSLDSSLKSNSSFQKVVKSLSLDKIGQSSQVYLIGNNYYCFRFVQMHSQEVLPFDRVKNVVQSEYIKEYRVKNAKLPQNPDWKFIENMKFDDVSDVPDVVLQALFFNPIKSLVRVDYGNKTYYVKVMSISQGNDFFAYENVRKYIESSMLSELISAAVNSLQFRYRVSMV